MKFSEDRYDEMLSALFVRFPSFQKVGAGAYKPGIASMEFADQLMGHPHEKYKVIHVAGTNGKGSVSNMLASVLAAAGYKVGLYTSPQILDFRERLRIVGEGMIPKEDVWDFVQQWKDTFDHLDMSFFEITTMMALAWFAAREADVVVLETGLGGRLDSTNIVTPVMSVITNIGLDHCDMLGDTLAEIAFEKAGIIKPKVPVTVGESHPETDPVFERKVLYTNIPEAEFMGNRQMIMSLLTFADKIQPPIWDRHEALLSRMDLQGAYQEKNLRTVLAVLWRLRESGLAVGLNDDDICDAIADTASRTGFRGRWEVLSENPLTICDIGHNGHGLKYNFWDANFDLHWTCYDADMYQLYPLVGLSYLGVSAEYDGEKESDGKLGVNLGFGGQVYITENWVASAEVKYQIISNTNQLVPSLSLIYKF